MNITKQDTLFETNFTVEDGGVVLNSQQQSIKITNVSVTLRTGWGTEDAQAQVSGVRVNKTNGNVVNSTRRNVHCNAVSSAVIAATMFVDEIDGDEAWAIATVQHADKPCAICDVENEALRAAGYFPEHRINELREEVAS